jgi:cobalamin biosynthetic protein CobC
LSARSEKSELLPHGGWLHAAVQRYGIPLAQWLDLSTGINPNGWPVPTLPAPVWNRLPEDDDGLEATARDYYGTPHVLPVAGSQAAIQALPQLIPPCRVALIRPGYAEHVHAWSRGGHDVVPVVASELDDAVASSTVVVLANPNNPTGALFPRAQLLRWREQLAERGGWLVIDEAFIDAIPGESLTADCPQPGLVVLRSLGKFFGLAGVRVGFVFADPALLQCLKALLGPWTVATPSRYVAMLTLNDRAWQQDCREKLLTAGARLAALLQRHGLVPHGGCPLFHWLSTARAAQIHDGLARRGILTRLYQDPPSLRFGLPATEESWSRLDASLGAVMASLKLCP